MTLTPAPVSTRPRRSLLRRTMAGSAVLLVLTTGLSACGGSDAGAAPSAGSTAAGRAGGAGREGGAQFQAIRACLQAAGIAVPTPTARPSGAPSGAPDGAPPSGAAPGGARGGQRRGGIDFTDAKVQAALKACGIAAPSGRPTAQPSS